MKILTLLFARYRRDVSFIPTNYMLPFGQLTPLLECN